MEGVERRGRLRPRRHLARPDGGGGLARASTSRPSRRACRAYAFFEFGPELEAARLRPAARRRGRGPGLVRRARRRRPWRADRHGRPPPARSARRRLELDEALDEARAKTGDGASDATVDHQRGDDRLPRGARGDPDHRRDHRLDGRRQPAPAPARLPRRAAGAAGQHAALPARRSSCSTRSRSTARSSRRWSGIVAIAVLLLVMNWFFHRVYWTEWISGHRKRGLKLAGAAAAGAARRHASRGSTCSASRACCARASRPCCSSRRCSSAPGPASSSPASRFGLLAVAAVGALTFKLEQRLPYKRMLVVTGVDDRARAGRDGGQHRAHHAGGRLAVDHAHRRRVPAVDGQLARDLPDGRDARGPGARPSPSWSGATSPPSGGASGRSGSRSRPTRRSWPRTRSATSPPSSPPRPPVRHRVPLNGNGSGRPARARQSRPDLSVLITPACAGAPNRRESRRLMGERAK